MVSEPFEKEGVAFSRSDWWLSLGLYVINLTVHFILLRYPPDQFFYNFDELDLTFSCLDRFLGVPSTIMMEPSSPLQMLSVPVFLTDFVVRRGIPHSLLGMIDAFSAYLADAYVDPRHHVILMRVVVAFIACAGPVLLFAVARRLGVSRWPSLLCAAVLFVHPEFFGRSLQAAGDAAGFAALLGAILILLLTDKGGATKFLAGFLYAMAIAFKLTMASSLVILLAFMWADPAWRNPRRAMKSLAHFGTGTVAGILLWWPYVWVEPLRTAKTIFGNVNKAGSHADVLQFVERMRVSAGTGFVAFMIAVVLASLWGGRRSPSRRLILRLLCSLAIMSVPLVMKATTAGYQYFIPLVLAPLLCFVLLTVKSPRLSIASLALLALATSVTLVRQQIDRRNPDELAAALKMVPRLPVGIRAYLPEDAGQTYAIRLPQSTYRRISVHVRDELCGRQEVVAFLRGQGISERAINTLLMNFNEDEQANAVHIAAAAESNSDSTSGVAIYLYSTENYTSRTSWADFDEAKAIELFRGRDPAAILVRSNEAKLGKAIWQGSEWTWYTNESASSTWQ